MLPLHFRYIYSYFHRSVLEDKASIKQPTRGNPNSHGTISTDPDPVLCGAYLSTSPVAAISREYINSSSPMFIPLLIPRILTTKSHTKANINPCLWNDYSAGLPWRLRKMNRRALLIHSTNANVRQFFTFLIGWDLVVLVDWDLVVVVL